MSLLQRGRQILIRAGWTDARSRSERDGWVTARSEQGQTSRVGIVRAAWYRGSKRRMVGGHKPGSAGSGQRGTEGQAGGWSGTSRGQSRRGSA
ncbi:unnamed protein product, partial [Staurois parvus]